MVARPRRELDIAELLQFPTHGRFIKRDRKFLMEPLYQVDQSPAHNPMDCRDRTALDVSHKRLTLGIIELGPLAGRLAINQRIRATGIEPHNPFGGKTIPRMVFLPALPHNLQTHTADPGRIAAAATIVDLSQRQQPSALVCVLRRPCLAPQCRPVKIRPQSYRCTHGHVLPRPAAIDSDFWRVGNPRLSQPLRRLVEVLGNKPNIISTHTAP